MPTRFSKTHLHLPVTKEFTNMYRIRLSVITDILPIEIYDLQRKVKLHY